MYLKIFIMRLITMVFSPIMGAFGIFFVSLFFSNLQSITPQNNTFDVINAEYVRVDYYTYRYDDGSPIYTQEVLDIGSESFILEYLIEDEVVATYRVTVSGETGMNPRIHELSASSDYYIGRVYTDKIGELQFDFELLSGSDLVVEPTISVQNTNSAVVKNIFIGMYIVFMIFLVLNAWSVLYITKHEPKPTEKPIPFAMRAVLFFVAFIMPLVGLATYISLGAIKGKKRNNLSIGSAAGVGVITSFILSSTAILLVIVLS